MAGRPSKYRKEYCDQAKVLTELGATDIQLCKFFSVSEPTLNKWKKDYPEFLKALKKGKGIADSEVVKSLYARATGYSHPDVHISNYQGTTTVTDITKHYPPDTTACIYWLNNRDRENWRARPEEGGAGVEEFAELMRLASKKM